MFITFLLFNSIIYPQETTQIQEITYFCTIDSTFQPAMYYNPDLQEKRPLLMGLHSWSATYKQNIGKTYGQFCIDNDWIFIFPNLRGKNNNPMATGSEYVIQDAQDAVNWIKNIANVDTNNIYLIGASGGGYTALL